MTNSNLLIEAMAQSLLEYARAIGQTPAGNRTFPNETVGAARRYISQFCEHLVAYLRDQGAVFFVPTSKPINTPLIIWEQSTIDLVRQEGKKLESELLVHRLSALRNQEVLAVIFEGAQASDACVFFIEKQPAPTSMSMLWENEEAHKAASWKFESYAFSKSTIPFA